MMDFAKCLKFVSKIQWLSLIGGLLRNYEEDRDCFEIFINFAKSSAYFVKFDTDQRNVADFWKRHDYFTILMSW